MSLVADVHTESNAGSVLEEAVGNPFLIFVAVLIGVQILLTCGGSFSYYEFAHPINDRLTDEALQEMLDGGLVPDFPEWTAISNSTIQVEGIFTMMVLSEDEYLVG